MNRRQYLGLFGAALVTPLLPRPPAGASPFEFGAVGDGVTDDTDAIQAAIDATAEGGTVSIPPGRFLVSATESRETQNAALHVSRSVRIQMDAQATLVLAPNGFETYAVINVVGDHVEIAGGRIEGDLEQHTGTEGEWGFGVRVSAAHVTLRDLYITRCWGDGIYIGPRTGGGTGNARDVSIVDCQCEDNRRQGLSIVDVDGCRVLGGAYFATGRTAEALGRGLALGPYLGIDIEPDAGSHVRATTIEGVTTVANSGGGIVVLGDAASTIELEVRNCTSVNDGDINRTNQHSASFGGFAGTFIGCIAKGASGSGFSCSRDTPPTPNPRPRWVDCVSYGARFSGFVVAGEVAEADVVGCRAQGNGQAGFKTEPQTSAVRLVDCVALDNGVERPAASFDIYGSNHLLQGCFASASPPPTNIGFNYVLRGASDGVGGTGHQVLGCLVGNPGGAGQFHDGSAGSTVSPVPGG